MRCNHADTVLASRYLITRKHLCQMSRLHQLYHLYSSSYLLNSGQRRCCSYAPLLFPLVLVVLCTPPTIKGELVQVTVIHRHGARRRLHKHATDPTNENIIDDRLDVLFPEGEEQLQRLGGYISETYGAQLKKIANPYSIVAYSSDLRRTLLSSRAFLFGLLGEKSRSVPTMMFNTSREDRIIRGYAVCPQLQNEFLEFINSNAYKEKEKDNEKFVKTSAEKLNIADRYSSFTEVFNVFDEYITRRYDGEDMSEIDGSKLKDLADWYESQKFHFGTRKVSVAGPLLRDLVYRWEDFSKDADNESGACVIEYSAHYPTLLTLLGLLPRDTSEHPLAPADAIPEFGSALLAELHDESDGYHVHLRWYSGGEEDDSVSVTEVKLNWDECAKSNHSCSLSGMQSFFDAGAFDLARFRQVCNAPALCDAGWNWLQRVGFLFSAAILGVLVGFLTAFRKMKYAEKRKEENEDNNRAVRCGGHNEIIDNEGIVRP